MSSMPLAPLAWPELVSEHGAKRAEFKVCLCFPKSLLPSPLLLGAPVLRLQRTQWNRSFLSFGDYWGSRCSHLSLGIRYAEDLGFLSRFSLVHLFRKTILSGKSFLLLPSEPLQVFQGSLFFLFLIYSYLASPHFLSGLSILQCLFSVI